VELLYQAAASASRTSEGHWAIRWVTIDLLRIRAASTIGAKRMHVDQFERDVEAIMRDIRVTA